jgi:hypothetical protein
MPVTLVFEADSRLPPLSWAVRLNGLGRALVHHGLDIETRADGFVEGAWDGDFERFDFDRAETFAGTGGRLRDGRLILVTPSHPLERLFVARRADELVASNSLVFVLAALGDRLDMAYPHYFFDLLAQTRRGLLGPPARLRTARGRTIEAFVHCNLEVPDASGFTRSHKPLGPAPGCFADFFRMLDGAMTGLAANAASPARRKRYPLVAACSRGYDSVASAALASRAGCRDGVTFTTSDVRAGHPLTGLDRETADDCGTPVLTALGMRAVEFDRLAILQMPGHPRAEFFLSPIAMTDASSLAMEPMLRGRVLVSGRHAERYWGLRIKHARRHLREGDDCLLSGHSLGEFRLRAGFLHFPAPYVGALHAPALRRIGLSDEMRPWRLDTRYNRPIARRIAEEQGVPREAFGQRKMGAGLISRALGPDSERDFRSFVAACVPEAVRRGLDPRRSPERREAHDKLAYLRTNYGYLPGVGLALDLARAERLHMLWNSVYLYQFHWGASKLAPRYDILGARSVT